MSLNYKPFFIPKINSAYHLDCHNFQFFEHYNLPKKTI